MTISMTNTIVNPFVYSLQYHDFKAELKRQWQMLSRRRYKDSINIKISTITISNI